MQVSLSDHVHLTPVGEDLVFLDLDRDTYLCVPGGALSLRPTPDRRGLVPLAAEGADDLVEAGLVVSTQGLSPRSGPLPQTRVPPSLPTQGLAVGAGYVRPIDGLRVLGALWDLLRCYPGRDLAGVLAAASPAGSAVGRAGGEVEALRLAGAFERLVLWLPLSSKCVVRSFLLLRVLQRSGCDASWVFGVRTWPFGAHCWLQLGDVALDDAPERLQTYAPILAVGP